MSVSLATAWNPRGEIPRFERLLPTLAAAYSGLAVSVPPFARREDIDRLRALIGDGLIVTEDWSHGRHAAMQKALEYPCTHVHYVDADRLLRWVETCPEEWQRVVEDVSRAECLVIGRTEAAWETHPQALRQTERISNAIFSHLLGQELDLSAGSKGFSRVATEFILANSRPGRALGTDSEWIVLAHRAGFRVETLLVDGLDWEIADRYQDRAADPERQRHIRDEYDAEARNWAMRVGVAVEIVEAGLEAMVYNNQEHSRHRLFYGGAAGAKTNFRQPTGQMRPQNSGNGHLADVVTRQFERALAADAYRASYNGQMVDKIDFLVIGAEKCGTTWLADMLRQHPEVFIPPEKELFYFNRQFFESPELENFNHAKPLSWYFAFFKNAAPEQVKGEVCVAYIWDEAAPQKIQAFNPGIKIIAILRDPVERAFSQYLYYIQRGVLGDVSFEQAIEMRPDLLSRSLYAGQLQRYYERFPPENIRVTFFDDLKADNRAFLQTIEAFLGISEFIPPDIDSRANVTGTPRYQWLNRAMSRVRYWVRKYDPPFLLDFLRFTGLAQFSEVLRLKNTRPAEGRPVIDPETEARLRAYFREDMEKLEKLTGRDHPLASCSRLRTTIVSSPMPTA